MNNKSLKTTGLLRLKTKIKIFLAVCSLLIVSVSLGTSAIKENSDNHFFMIDSDINSGFSPAEFESHIERTSQNNPPETPDKPSGPTFIEVGVSYTFYASTYDPDGDFIRYRFDWGDGNISNWTHWETSNIPVSVSYIRTSTSTFNIKVIAQDENGINSSWSPVLDVTASQADPGETPSFVNESVDNFENFIWNSNSKYWKPTADNLEAAISDLPDGGTIWLPDCTIVTNNRIDLCSNLKIVGVGKRSIVRLGDDLNTAIFRTVNSVHDIIISNVGFDGNNHSQTNHNINMCAVLVLTANNITIQNCYLWNFTGCGIYAAGTSSNVTIDSCYINGCQKEGWNAGILFSGSDCIARNNFIEDTWACGIICEGTNPICTRCIIDGNTITGETSHGIHCENNKCNNITIINNYIHDLNSTAYVGHWSRGIVSGAKDIICSDNVVEDIQEYGIYFHSGTIKGNIVRNIHDDDGIYTSAYADVIIKDNTVENIGDIGIHPYHSGDSNATVNNNRVYNTTNEGIYVGGNGTVNWNYVEKTSGAGIHLGAVSGKRITAIGNQIINTTSYGVQTGADIVVNFIGNTINNVGGSPGNGILWSAKNGTIIDNIIENTANYGIWLYNSSVGVSVIGNFISTTGNAAIRIHIEGVRGIVSMNYISSTCSNYITGYTDLLNNLWY